MNAIQPVTAVGFSISSDCLTRSAVNTARTGRVATLVSLAVLASATLGCVDMTSDEPSGLEVTGFTAQIQRTSFGIPHIEAADEKGLGFGAGYSFAQDNICLLEEEITTVNGQRSLYFGGDATYEPSSDGATVHNLSSDVFFSVLNAPDRVAASWDEQPAEIKDLIVGYAHGVNHFLHLAAGALPDACRGQPWVRDITELDVVRVMRRFAVEASSERMIEGLFAARPPVTAPTSEVVLRGADLANSPIWAQFQPSLGSNGIALGNETTTSRAGLLLASPHFPWRGVFRFYQLHLVIPGRVDAMGATPAGLPVVGIGHNAHVAWTHTVNSSRHFTFHQLTLDPVDPTRYLVDGQSRQMTATDVEVQVRQPTGVVTVTHRVWSSELGPMIIMPGAFGWTARTAFAFGDANADNTRFLRTWWAIDQASSLAELRTAIENSLGIPWVNTIAVDAGGTAYLGDVTPVPNLPADKACVPAPFAALAATGTVVLDGSTAHCGWQVVAGTPVPGLVPAANLPALKRTDFVQNSNDSAWLTNPAAPLTGFPAIVSRDGIEQNPRTRQGLTYLVGEHTAGRRISARGLLDFAFSNRAFIASNLLPDLRKLCATSTSCGGTPPAPSAACRLLASWDGTANLGSVGWPEFQAWRQSLDAATKASGLNYWKMPFDPTNPIATPSGLRISDPVVETAARDALDVAGQKLSTAGIDPARAWGSLQQTKRGNKLIPIHGAGDDRSDDSKNEFYNKILSRTVEGRLEPFYGTSIVMAISFEGGVPAAQGVLTYSQSSDPASPHFGDQTERFSRKDWIAFPYTKAAIEADPDLTVEEITE